MILTKIITHRQLLIFIISGMLVTACTTKNPVVGAWNQVDGNKTWEFLQNGSFTLTEPGATLTGTYELLDNHQLLIKFNQYEELIQPTIFSYSLVGDHLTLSSDLYGQLEYQRIILPSSGLVDP